MRIKKDNLKRLLKNDWFYSKEGFVINFDVYFKNVTIFTVKSLGNKKGTFHNWLISSDKCDYPFIYTNNPYDSDIRETTDF